VAPKGFTRRYGNMIAARIPIVVRDGLDTCVYQGATAPAKKSTPPVVKKARPIPGEEFESTKPLTQVEMAPEQQLQQPAESAAESDQSPPPPTPSDNQPKEPGNGV
jgi:monofunctional biosynthetic peptidoglycan transglycosylase